jgi:hypothetical protein
MIDWRCVAAILEMALSPIQDGGEYVEIFKVIAFRRPSRHRPTHRSRRDADLSAGAQSQPKKAFLVAEVFAAV